MLRVRWLGRVPYREALALQEGLFRHGTEQHLLLLEHPHVFTHGPRADLATNVRVEPAAVVPRPAEADAYDRLYAEYRELHDHFAGPGRAQLHRLRAIRNEARR